MKNRHNVISLEECESTNNRLAEIAHQSPHGTVVITSRQTAGRGQRGNSWEAEPGKNLTFSLLIKPENVAAHDQFYISEAVALGIADSLRRRLPGIPVSVKWPNDIYAGDKKICGILIDNSLSGNNIGHSIAGIGINVNQRQFRSDAPNPVSAIMLTGEEIPLDELLHDTVDSIFRRLSQPLDARHADYMTALWRRDGGNYRDAATGEEFHAVITGVAPTGHLSLLDTFGNTRTYAFKEVTALL